MTGATLTASTPLTATLAALLPEFGAALPGLFRAAPHPPLAWAHGVAVDIAGLARHVSPAHAASMAPPELARAVPLRQMSYVAGRLCAEEALRRLGHAGPVGRGRNGEPRWPAQVMGSITHTDRMACALVAPNGLGRRGLGIDSERIDDDASLQAVLSICCTPDERATLFAGQHEARADRLVAAIVFALKEAFYKAIHPTVGRFVDFDELEVHTIEPAAGRAGLRPVSSELRDLLVPRTSLQQREPRDPHGLRELPPDAAFEGRFNVLDDTVHAVVQVH